LIHEEIHALPSLSRELIRSIDLCRTNRRRRSIEPVSDNLMACHPAEITMRRNAQCLVSLPFSGMRSNTQHYFLDRGYKPCNGWFAAR
jgi:hypothetical protein